MQPGTENSYRAHFSHAQTSYSGSPSDRGRACLLGFQGGGTSRTVFTVQSWRNLA